MRRPIGNKAHLNDASHNDILLTYDTGLSNSGTVSGGRVMPGVGLRYDAVVITSRYSET